MYPAYISLLFYVEIVHNKVRHSISITVLHRFLLRMFKRWPNVRICEVSITLFSHVYVLVLFQFPFAIIVPVPVLEP